MRPSANVTNWRPIAPPYNNFAPVLFTIFVGTRHSDIDLGSLCWHSFCSFRDSQNSSVQPKFRFRLKQSALDILRVLTRLSLILASKQSVTGAKTYWINLLSNLESEIWNLSTRNTFPIKMKTTPSVKTSWLMFAKIWHLTLLWWEWFISADTPLMSPGRVVSVDCGLLSPLRAPAPVTRRRQPGLLLGPGD